MCLLYPYLPTFKPPTQTFVWHFWKIKCFLRHFHQKIMIFPLCSNVREKICKKKKKKKRNPTYLPNQKIQGRGTANKQFFKDGPIPMKECCQTVGSNTRTSAYQAISRGTSDPAELASPLFIKKQ